jgi:branched-subunit amino acid ABC-type transport system permease component
MDPQSLSQFFFSGLSTGCIYALVAVGYVLCFNATGVINFAQGEYVMVGALVAAFAHAHGLPLTIAIAAAVAAGGIVGFAQERLTLAPIRSSPDFIRVTVTFGFAVVLRGLAMVVAGADPLPLPGFSGDDVFELLGAFLAWQIAWVWLLTILVLAIVFYFLMRTRWGRAVRGCSENLMAARLMGIAPERVALLVLSVGGALAALGGAVVAPITLASWTLGIDFGLKGFIAALLAGFRSPQKAVAIALSVGVIETAAAGLVSSGARDIIVYGMLLAYLLISAGVSSKRQQLTMIGH